MHHGNKKMIKPDPRRLRLKMVKEQLLERGISDESVINAMTTVQRHLFVDEALAALAYKDSALPIGYGQTISQPFTVALMSQLLEAKKGMRILEIGTGSGYQSAVLASMGCSIYTVERIPELYHRAKSIFQQLFMSRIRIYNNDGTMGLPLQAPFDRIIVTAGGPSIPPPLIEQLDKNGILLIPVGSQPRTQHLVKVCKNNGKIEYRDMGSVFFVDLIGNHGW